MGAYVDAFASWLGATPMSMYLQSQTAWLWPVCETLHFMGLTVLVGAVGFFDLRLLGVIKRVSIPAAADLLPWAAGGFGVNLITGMVFLVSEPSQYAASTAWWAKVFFLVVALLNVAVFEKLLKAKAHALQLGADTPTAFKIAGALSLIAWSGVLYFGRMMPYIGAPEFAGF